jgi:predicted dithiol-disulfide oxidoreductase (DUF899 family)
VRANIHLPEQHISRGTISSAAVGPDFELTPWASSFRNDFNSDFGVSFTEEQQQAEGIDHNYLHGGYAMGANGTPEAVRQLAAMCGTDTPTYMRDRPGISAFVLKEGTVYHTYSTYSRGVDGLCGAHQWLDRAPIGRDQAGT